MLIDVDLLMKMVALAISAGAFAMSLIAIRRKAVDREIAQTAEALTKQDARIAVVERQVGSIQQTVDHLPGKSEIHQLEITLTRISGQMDTMSEAMSGQREIMARLEAIVSRHEDHLLEGKR